MWLAAHHGILESLQLLLEAGRISDLDGSFRHAGSLLGWVGVGHRNNNHTRACCTCYIYIYIYVLLRPAASPEHLLETIRSGHNLHCQLSACRMLCRNMHSWRPFIGPSIEPKAHATIPSFCAHSSCSALFCWVLQWFELPGAHLNPYSDCASCCGETALGL